MRARALPGSLAVALALGACGSEPDVAAPTPAAGPARVAGLYRVEGTTTVVESGDTRRIHGSVILAQEEDRYTATFQLATIMPSEDGPLPAEVVGKGEGRIDGNRLQGSAETQILMGMVPGADAKFPFLPQVYGPRLESSSTATVAEDGTLRIEIENRPAEGERYAPTRTVLKGRRVAAAAVPEP